MGQGGLVEQCGRGLHPPRPAGLLRARATLSLPFWLICSLTDWQLLEGLPASSFMFACPVAPVADRWGIGRAGILLGLVWGLWHVVPYLQAGRSLAWIFWYGLVETVSLRVLIVWLYRSAGRSVLAAALCHATVNVTFFFFPNYGSHYDPLLVGLLVALTAALVTVVWGRLCPRGTGCEECDEAWTSIG